MNELEREVIIPKDVPDVVISSNMKHISYPEHWHLFAEILLQTKGDSNYAVRGVPYDLSEGDILIIWPTELHEVLYAPQDSAIMLQFSADFIRDNPEVYLLYRSMQGIHKIGSDAPELQASVAALVREINAIHNSKVEFMGLKIKLKLYEILMELAHYARVNAMELDICSARAPHQTDTYQKIQNACRYITDNCERDLMEGQVADHIGFSSYYFSRIFKKYTGESYSDFLTRQRIRKAVEMLSSDNISVTEIGFFSGFQSVSNFNRAFKATMGCSPTQYRKMHTGRTHTLNAAEAAALDEEIFRSGFAGAKKHLDTDAGL